MEWMVVRRGQRTLHKLLPYQNERTSVCRIKTNDKNGICIVRAGHNVTQHYCTSEELEMNTYILQSVQHR